LLTELLTVVDELDIRAGMSKSLGKKLENSLENWLAGNDEDAFDILGAFINQMEAQSGKKIQQNDADYLIDCAMTTQLLMLEE